MVPQSPDLEQSLKKDYYLKRLVREQILPHRFINYGRNTKLSKCIGLIGPRGSGKSISASAIAIRDYLIPGYKVISNMNVRYPFRINGYMVGYESEALDKMEMMKFEIEENVAVLIDEVNIEFSEARRSMTNRNLIFNKILQQLRKRSLNMIYTVQHEMWIDNRLRWQTDIFIKCQDFCMKPGGIYLPYEFGEMISWKIFDMSGIFGQGSYVDTGKVAFDGVKLKGKQWWGTFNTDEIQGGDEGTYATGGLPFAYGKGGELEVLQNNDKRIREIFEEAQSKNYDLLPSSELWRLLNLPWDNRKQEYEWKERHAAGQKIAKMGIKYIPGSKSYRVPQVNLDNPETMEVPIGGN